MEKEKVRKALGRYKCIYSAFDCDKTFYDDGRIDIIAAGFNRMLNDLYNEGILTHKPMKVKGEFKKYNHKPEKMEFECYFEKT